MKPGESRGIEITKTGKGVDGQLLMQKEIVKAGVFKDSIAPPTMSLAEFGDMEKVRFDCRMCIHSIIAITLLTCTTPLTFLNSLNLN